MAAFVYLLVPPPPLDTWLGNSPEHETAFTAELIQFTSRSLFNLSHSLK